MTLTSCYKKRPPACRHRDGFRPRLDILEDRTLLSAGALDLTFGASSNGKVFTDFGGVDEGFGMALQDDGKIVVAGTAFNSADEGNFALARYLANGAPDLNFGTAGKVVTDFFADDQAYSVAIQNDGKI